MLSHFLSAHARSFFMCFVNSPYEITGVMNDRLRLQQENERPVWDQDVSWESAVSIEANGHRDDCYKVSTFVFIT